MSKINVAIIGVGNCASPYRGHAGPLLAPSSYFMKSPPKQHHDDQARAMVEAFIAEG